ncbi:hypothetical protein PTQ19_12085 [Microbacterium esteraromaticum]|uniref:hypothetical protein n=1 Tax=Microbacterium esteraromaticum TaxID=57043 RepID=UPI002367AD64|nr:hypothetical protein [Microbacterium esteraromaticum]WDH78250.1 hypothetical protein PTQ19_12085 [Microbacterium esteraromaticum]
MTDSQKRAQGGTRTAFAAAVLVASLAGCGGTAALAHEAPATTPHHTIPTLNDDLRASVDWDAEEWLERFWPYLPGTSQAVLHVIDFGDEDRYRVAGAVMIDHPDVVLLNEDWLAWASDERAWENVLSLAAHELVHSALAQDGVPIPDALLLDESDRSWAAGAMDEPMGSDADDSAAHEAIASCIEETITPGTATYYLSAPCPSTYVEEALTYLNQITGDDWGALSQPGHWVAQKTFAAAVATSNTTTNNKEALR